jgi:hypothetical protein
MRRYTTIREAVTAAVREGTKRDELSKELGIDSDFGWWLANHWRRRLTPAMYDATKYTVAREI